MSTNHAPAPNDSTHLPHRPPLHNRHSSTTSNPPRSPFHPSSSHHASPNLTAANLQLHGSMHPPPHHNRQPSLSSLHQSLEEEQEGQVNRLLSQIRDQQTQISRLANERDRSRDRDASAVLPNEEALSTSVPNSAGLDRSSRSSSRAERTPLSAAVPFPGLGHRTSQGSLSLSRQSSARGRPVSPRAGGLEDEVERMVVETQMVGRENLMLKGRVRELERLVAEARARAGE